jgi:hypothetical protein
MGRDRCLGLARSWQASTFRKAHRRRVKVPIAAPLEITLGHTLATKCALRACFVLLTLWLNADLAWAKGNGYICKITKFGFLNESGTLDFKSDDVRIGKTFAVDRRSGSIIGDWVTTENWNTTVLDVGSKSQSFKMIATTEPIVHVMYLNVQEYASGSIKPFVFLDDTMVVTGTCE